MAEEGWYSRYYKDKINKQLSDKEAKNKDPVIDKDRQVKLTKEFISEVVKTNPPKPSSSRYLEFRDKEVQKQDGFARVEKPIEPVQNIITPKEKPKFHPYYSKPYYRDFEKHPKIVAEPIEEKKPKPDPYQVLAEVQGKIKPEKEEYMSWIILGVVIVIILIIIGVYFSLNMKANQII